VSAQTVLAMSSATDAPQLTVLSQDLAIGVALGSSIQVCGVARHAQLQLDKGLMLRVALHSSATVHEHEY
jgi:hypothetical protein